MIELGTKTNIINFEDFIMNTTEKTNIFTSKEQFLTYKAQWAKTYQERHLPSWAFAINTVVTGKDIFKAFKLAKSQHKLMCENSNGLSAIKLALPHLKAVMDPSTTTTGWGGRRRVMLVTKVTDIFGSTITPEMCESLCETLEAARESYTAKLREKLREVKRVNAEKLQEAA